MKNVVGEIRYDTEKAVYGPIKQRVDNHWDGRVWSRTDHVIGGRINWLRRLLQLKYSM